MILLTDEEINKLGLDPQLPREYMWHLQVVAKAQLKKVVEWMDGHGYIQLRYGEPVRAVLQDEWQSLLDEV